MIFCAILFFIPSIQDHATAVSETVLYGVLGGIAFVLFFENLFYKFRNIKLNKLTILFKGRAFNLEGEW